MLNETNITIDVARVLIETQNPNSDFVTLISQLLIPLISIITTGYIAYYTITNNARSIVIQANQSKINEALATLSQKIDMGQPEKIRDFLNSKDGVYIPKSLRNKIKKGCSGEKINLEQKNKMLDEVNKYIWSSSGN